MTRPGVRLRTIASRLCSAQTMERVIDPLIADLQLEHAEMNQRGHLWSGRWIRLAAGIALLKVIVLCGARSLVSLEEASTDEHRAMIRTGAVSIGWMGAVVVLLLAPFWRTDIRAARPYVLPFLIPQALPLAIPIGLTFGILVGFRGRILSRRLIRIVLTTAVALSALSFVILGWVIPAANQSFREVMARSYWHGKGTPQKGPNEMTLGELDAQIHSYRDTRFAASPFVRNFMFSYHQRSSLACATAVLALFAVGVLAHRPSARRTVLLAGLAACWTYYVLLFLGRSAALGGTIPAVAAWFPNVVFVLFSILLCMMRSERRVNPARTR